MSNNYWQPQNNQNGSTEPGVPPRKSGLLSNYGNQSSSTGPSFLPPANNPAPQGPSSSSPLPPPSPYQSRPMPGPQGAPNPGIPPQQLPNGPTFMAGPGQMIQRISGKMASLRRPAPVVDQNPMVRYRETQPPVAP